MKYQAIISGDKLKIKHTKTWEIEQSEPTCIPINRISYIRIERDDERKVISWSIFGRARGAFINGWEEEDYQREQHFRYYNSDRKIIGLRRAERLANKLNVPLLEHCSHLKRP